MTIKKLIFCLFFIYTNAFHTYNMLSFRKNNLKLRMTPYSSDNSNYTNYIFNLNINLNTNNDNDDYYYNNDYNYLGSISNLNIVNDDFANINTINDYSSYLDNLNVINYNFNTSNTYDNKLIRKIDFNELVLYNNYISAVYYRNNSNSDRIIIEFKNNTKKVYYYDDNYYNVKLIVHLIKNITLINLEDYPYYIINNPFGFLLCENK